MDEGYFEWLLNRAGVSREDTGYSFLCDILHDIGFYPLVEMDENRCQDGIRYRNDYGMERQDDDIPYILDEGLGGCTVLELLVSLADKMSFEMMDSQFEAGTGKWFEELLSNLGLDIYTNRELMENEAAYFEAEGIVQKFVWRKYLWNGEGGLFPLRHPSEDQRNVELAIQMNNYLAENYDLLG